MRGKSGIVLQAVATAHPDLPKVPVAIELAKTDEAKKLIQAGIHDTAAITRPYALPPGHTEGSSSNPAPSFSTNTLKDKDFLAEAVKSKLDVDPLSGEEVEKIVAGPLQASSPPSSRKWGRSSSRFHFPSRVNQLKYADDR